MTRRCAVLVRGGVSPLDRQYKSIRRQPGEIERVDVSVVRRSIQIHLEEANPNWNFEFFIFSWDRDMSDKLSHLYQPIESLYEDNDEFRTEIWILVARSLINALRSNRTLLRAKLKNWRASLAQDFSGISQALAISKAADLVLAPQPGYEHPYERVILLRPDVVLFEDVDLESMPDKAVVCNQYLERCGDFRWTFHPMYLGHFSDLPAHFANGGIHTPHTWIRDYFDKMGVPYVADRLLAGQSEEVLRKTKSNGHSFEKLSRYGLSKEEYDRYPS